MFYYLARSLCNDKRSRLSPSRNDIPRLLACAHDLFGDCGTGTTVLLECAHSLQRVPCRAYTNCRLATQRLVD